MTQPSQNSFDGIPVGDLVVRVSGDGKGLRGPYKRWRRVARRFARLNGFYWLPCVLCGEPHGGQEPTGLIPTSDESVFKSICPFCTAERQQAAERRLAELGETAWGGAGSSSTGRESPVHRIPYANRRDPRLPEVDDLV